MPSHLLKGAAVSWPGEWAWNSEGGCKFTRGRALDVFGCPERRSQGRRHGPFVERHKVAAGVANPYATTCGRIARAVLELATAPRQPTRRTLKNIITPREWVSAGDRRDRAHAAGVGQRRARRPLRREPPRSRLRSAAGHRLRSAAGERLRSGARARPRETLRRHVTSPRKRHPLAGVRSPRAHPAPLRWRGTHHSTQRRFGGDAEGGGAKAASVAADGVSGHGLSASVRRPGAGTASVGSALLRRRFGDAGARSSDVSAARES